MTLHPLRTPEGPDRRGGHGRLPSGAGEKDEARGYTTERGQVPVRAEGRRARRGRARQMAHPQPEHPRQLGPHERGDDPSHRPLHLRSRHGGAVPRRIQRTARPAVPWGDRPVRDDPPGRLRPGEPRWPG
ncbi:hypothetical protein SGPA1_30756 [Streptomyces misionensis JCM 4497]